MRKTVFFRRCESVDWPKAIQVAFKVANYQQPELEFGSEAEARFLALCTQKKVENLSRTDVWFCPPAEVEEYPFFHLVIGGHFMPPKNQFIDSSCGCPGDGQNPCGKGSVQREKLVLPEQKMTDLSSILRCGTYFIVVSRRIRDLALKNDLKGLNFVPCLTEGKNYGQADYDLETCSAELNDTADFFQMIVVNHVATLPDAGNVIVRSRCSACGVVRMAFFDGYTGRIPTYRPEHLHDVDFQIQDGWQTSNEGVVKLKGANFIVSSKFMRLLIENKASGLQTINGSGQLSIVALDYLV